MSESFGLEGRGAFYDEVGALRDVVQNHLLQIVALLAMEPPVTRASEAMREEKIKVLKAMKTLDPAKVVRGQVEGYRDEDGVASDSDTETFIAMTVEIDSWRWQGVPFYIRTGKALNETVTDAVIQFRQPPSMLFSEQDECPEPNRLKFRLKPDDGISLGLQTKVPGLEMKSAPVDLHVDYEAALGGDGPDAYHRLIADAIVGDERLFAHQSGVEEAWRIVEPLLKPEQPVVLYPAGSVGPAEANRVAPLATVKTEC